MQATRWVRLLIAQPRNALVSVNMAETMVDSIQNFKSYVVATSVIDDCFPCN